MADHDAGGAEGNQRLATGKAIPQSGRHIIEWPRVSRLHALVIAVDNAAQFGL